MKDWLAIGFMSAVFLAFLGLYGTLLVQRIVFVSSAFSLGKRIRLW